MEDGLAEFFARAPAAATAETHFAAQWKAYASDEPLTAALWLINNADPGAFHEAPARIAALKKAAKKYSLEKHSASPDQAKLAALREDIFTACGNVKLPPDANYVREYTQRKQQKLARDAHALQAGALASDHARKVTEQQQLETTQRKPAVEWTKGLVPNIAQKVYDDMHKATKSPEVSTLSGHTGSREVLVRST